MMKHARPVTAVLSGALLWIVLGACVLVAAPAAASGILVFPGLAVDTLPFELVVDVPSAAGPRYHRDTLIDLGARTIHVRFDIPVSPIDPPAPGRYIHFETIEPLPEGVYTIFVEAYLPGSDVLLGQPAETILVVSRGAVLDLPSMVTTNDVTVPMTFEVFAGCGSVEALDIDDAARTITIVFLPDCPVTPPPPPTDLTVPVDLPGPFAAGPWTVEVAYEDFLGNRSPRGVAQLDVIADPLELAGGRFAVEVAWEDFDGGSGRGRAVQAPSRDTGLFWFFDPENTELMVKVLDACDVNGRFWALTAGSTNVAYALTITDRETGAVWRSNNPLGRLAPAVIDVEAFDCSLGDP